MSTIRKRFYVTTADSPIHDTVLIIYDNGNPPRPTFNEIVCDPERFGSYAEMIEYANKHNEIPTPIGILPKLTVF